MVDVRGDTPTSAHYDEAKMTGTCCDRHPEIPGVPNNITGTLEQKKTNSWTPVGQATDKKAPAQTN